MKPSRWLWVFAALGLFFTLPTHSDPVANNSREFVLFDGTNLADSTERRSPWIPIRGATQVLLRIWTAGATADTDFCDSATNFKVCLGDSVASIVRDSSGSYVTIGRYTSAQDAGTAFPLVADSTMITDNASDSIKCVAVYGSPAVGLKPLRGSVTGSGRYMRVFPTSVLPSAAAGNITSPAYTEVFGVQYMRLRILPRTRLTTAGFSSTAGLRTRGFNQLRVRAIVVYP